MQKLWAALQVLLIQPLLPHQVLVQRQFYQLKRAVRREKANG